LDAKERRTWQRACPKPNDVWIVLGLQLVAQGRNNIKITVFKMLHENKKNKMRKDAKTK
jgi:hypothetical protein